MADIARISLELDSAPLQRGVANARRLLEELSGAAEAAGKGVGGAGRAGRGAAEGFEKGARSASQYAQVLARLEASQGNYARATEVLKGAQSKLIEGTVEHARVQQQLLQVQSQAEAAAQRNLQAYVQLKLASGNYDAAIRVLTQDLAKLEKGSTAAYNAQRQIIEIQNRAKAGGGKLSLAQDIGGLPGLGGLGRLASEAANVSRVFQGASASVGALGGALAVTGGAAAGVAVGMLVAAKNTAAYAKEVEVAARATGLTTDAIQGLASEGRIIGADFHDIIDLVNQFSTQLGDARNGSAELQKVFKGIGIDAKTFGGDVNEAIDISLRALGKMPAGIQRTILASRLFGEEGARQILSMKGLEGGLAGLTAKYQAYGNVLSQQAIQESKKFNDELLRLELRLEGVRNKIGSSVIPAINDLFDTIGRTVSGESFKTFMQALDFSGSKGQAEAQRRLLGFPTTGRSVADGQPYGPPGPSPRLSPPPTATSTKAGRASSVAELSPEVAAQIQRFADVADLAGKDIEQLRTAYLDNQRETDRWTATMKAIAASGQIKTKEYAQAVDKVVEGFNKQAAILDALRLPGVSLNRLDLFSKVPQREPNQLPTNILDRGGLFGSIPASAIPGLGEAIGKGLSGLRSTPTFKEELFGSGSGSDRTRGAADDITEDFLRGILSGRTNIREAAANLAGDFADFLGDFSARKINELLRKQLEKSFDSLFDFLGGVLGKLFSGLKGKLSGIGGFFGDILGGLFGGGFGGFKAGGGDINPGKFYVVGERGPELLASRGSASIIPNGAAVAMAGGGGGGGTYNFHFHGIQNMQDFRKNENEIRRQLAAGVEQGKRMGGAR